MLRHTKPGPVICAKRNAVWRIAVFCQDGEAEKKTGNFYETFPFTNGGFFAMIDITQFVGIFYIEWQMQLDNLYLVC